MKATLKEEKQLINNNNNKITDKDESLKSPDFFQDNNPIKKKITKPYTTTRIKLINFYQTFHMLELTKKIFTTKTLRLIFMP